MSHASPSVLRTVGAIGVLTVAVALSGCTDPGDPSSSPSASPSPSTSPSASASPAPSDDPVASPSAGPSTPIDASCLDLVSLQTMYDFDPNFGLRDPFTPAAGSRGATAVGFDGVACTWVQQTSGDTIEIAVAAPPAAELTSLRSSAGETADGTTFFTTEGGVGIVQVFDGAYWIVVSSSYFGSAADASSLTGSVADALG